MAKFTVARVLKSLGLALLPHLVLLKLLLLIDPKCLLYQRCFLLFQQNHVHWFAHVRPRLAAGAAATAALCQLMWTSNTKPVGPPNWKSSVWLQVRWKLEWRAYKVDLKCLMKAHFRCQLLPLINPLKVGLANRDL